MKMQTDVLIIGAGAAGLMCALHAAKRGKQVIVVDKQGRIGKKILISGGGRCNFTHLHSSPEYFLSENSHFCKSALARFTPRHFLDLIEKNQIEYFEKTPGQLFCRHSAKEITAMFEKECREAGVRFALKCDVENITSISQSEPLGSNRKLRFTVKTNRETYQTRSIVIATGGLSFPRLGATDFGFRIAKQFGLHVCETYPGLVPLRWNSVDLSRFKDLSGISLRCRASCGTKHFVDDMLFTHRGLSGPAILQISSYWRPGGTIRIDLFPNFDLAEALIKKKQQKDRTLLKNAIAQWLPSRLTETWCRHFEPSRPMAAYTEKKLRSIAARLKQWEINPEASEGYEKAEVTCGGVDTQELNSKTMEARNVSGLFFIGEVVDVTGHLGGHNFQWAWASGAAAAEFV